MLKKVIFILQKNIYDKFEEKNLKEKKNIKKSALFVQYNICCIKLLF